MPAFGLPILDEHGLRRHVRAADGGLGYEHVVVEDEDGGALALANVPAESPPAGEFPFLDEFGGEHLISYEVVDASGDGPALTLRCYIGSHVTARYRMIQIGDHSLVQFDIFDRDPEGVERPVDLSTALVLEGKFRRADHSLITRPGIAATPSGSAVANRLAVQLEGGDVNGAGEWLMQARVVLADGREFHGQVRRVVVAANV